VLYLFVGAEPENDSMTNPKNCSDPPAPKFSQTMVNEKVMSYVQSVGTQFRAEWRSVEMLCVAAGTSKCVDDAARGIVRQLFAHSHRND
jgi:hypothetical protein